MIACPPVVVRTIAEVIRRMAMTRDARRRRREEAEHRIAAQGGGGEPSRKRPRME